MKTSYTAAEARYAAATPTERPSRLAFIEGLRGIAAYIVMAGHALRKVPHNPADHPLGSFGAAGWLERAVWPLTFGNQMVALFIFVSGFSLYYSEARRRERQGATPLGTYVKRRLWRILPVYYAALLFAVGLFALAPRLDPRLAPLIGPYAALSWESFAAHLALLHHLHPAWMYGINQPLWSIPVEAQLYLVFPLLILAMTRLSPLWGAIAGIGLYHAAWHVVNLSFVRYFEEFVVGMLTAHIAMNWPRRWAVPLAVAGCGALAVAVYRGPDAHGGSWWLAGFVGLVLACYHLPPGRWNPPTWRPIRAVGLVSYSLYVIHDPLLLMLYAGVREAGWSTMPQVIAMVGVGSLLCLVAAWGLYLTVERYSMRRIHGEAPPPRAVPVPLGGVSEPA